MPLPNLPSSLHLHAVTICYLIPGAILLREAAVAEAASAYPSAFGSNSSVDPACAARLSKASAPRGQMDTCAPGCSAARAAILQKEEFSAFSSIFGRFTRP